MNLIFLDIDGVLNSDLWYQKNQSAQTARHLAAHLDPLAVKRLNKILLQANAKVVLSSTWRHHYTLFQLQQQLEQVGFEGTLLDKTPDLCRTEPSFVRGNEILKWCQLNEAILGCSYQTFASYAILDDKADMLYWQRKHFFQIDRYCGLSPNVVRKVIQHLHLHQQN